MSKLFTFNMVTLDGYFEGPNGAGDIGWHNADEEFNDFAVQQLHEIGMIVFGRVTYEGMASFWPTPLALETDPVVASLMNSVPKIAASRTLNTADWHNTRLVRTAVAEELARLKAQSDKDIAIFGSANLIASLMPSGVIDEHRVIVNPMVLGGGTPLFKSGTPTTQLKRVRSHTFKSGNVLLCYQPV